MAAVIYVKPGEGRRIRQPNRNFRVMPDEGDYVSVDDVFYARCLAAGDVVKADDPAEVVERTAPASKRSKDKDE